MARPSKADQQAARAAREAAQKADRPTSPAEPSTTSPHGPSTPSSETSDLAPTNQPHALGDEPLAPSTSGVPVPAGPDGVPVFEPLLTVEEVSLWLRKPKGTLYAWRSRGLGPRAYKVGNDIRYAPSEVLRWLGSVA